MERTGGGKIKRGADRHYPVLPKHEIIRVIYNSGVFNLDSDCHLYLWATNNHLQDALFVMEALGFRYITNLIWSKDRIGLGQYFRGQHEILLFGVHGRLMTKEKLPTVVMAQRTLHSKKPVEIYELIEKCSPPPYIEMFARNEHDGWDSWGNEI